MRFDRPEVSTHEPGSAPRPSPRASASSTRRSGCSTPTARAASAWTPSSPSPAWPRRPSTSTSRARTTWSWPTWTRSTRPGSGSCAPPPAPPATTRATSWSACSTRSPPPAGARATTAARSSTPPPRAEPGSDVHARTVEHKNVVRAWVTDLARRAGAADPDLLARQLTLLIDGGLVRRRPRRRPGHPRRRQGRRPHARRRRLPQLRIVRCRPMWEHRTAARRRCPIGRVVAEADSRGHDQDEGGGRSPATGRRCQGSSRSRTGPAQSGVRAGGRHVVEPRSGGCCSRFDVYSSETRLRVVCRRSTRTAMNRVVSSRPNGASSAISAAYAAASNSTVWVCSHRHRAEVPPVRREQPRPAEHAAGAE